jgi:hypothetical protein
MKFEIFMCSRMSSISYQRKAGTVAVKERNDLIKLEEIDKSRL